MSSRKGGAFPHCAAAEPHSEVVYLMRFSRAQIIGAIFILALIWLVIAIRLIISRG